ncbi:sodium/myo-inositol cotransporter-like [Oppia nitens]|uniref:sodium/myo-inositol cotransporter-like n=1 Tax=Oppia nitens TaxID=1686743 RepID=UPI0023DB7E09|nr:sodium/myo-inositol cotransporter-like [Oppia nitens]
MSSLSIGPIVKVLNGTTFNDSPNAKSLDGGDISVVVVYFMLVLATGFYAMYRSNRGTVNGYFLAGRFMIWLPVGASVFASNIGSEHFIGLAGSGAASGIGVGAFEFNALIILQITGWIFLPVFIASKVCTLPEYMSKRFGGNRIRTYLAILSMLLYIFTKISVNLYSGGIFIQQALGWNLYYSVILLLAITSICTICGGLTAVIYTDTFQCLVMIVGASVVAIKGLIEVGGFWELKDKYMKAIPSTIPSHKMGCAVPKENSFQMLRSLDDPDMPWLGFILGQTPASIWYWCADQMMVQRLLAAKSLSHAQGGTLFAGFLKITPVFLIIIPGMISRVLYPDEVACVDADKCMQYCNNPISCSNTAYPKLVLNIMPSPFKGLILAVMLAALMSDLSSVFNSSSTLFTCDIWPLIRKNAKLAELMIVGRCFVIVMVVISILWIPIIQEMQNGELYIYIQDIAANLAPPIAAVYILAILWKRINESGAFWALIIGLIAGIIRLIVNIIYIQPSCGEVDTHPEILKIHYMYFAIIVFWLSIISAIIISYITEQTEEYRLIRTTYWTRFDNRERTDEIVTNISQIERQNINTTQYSNGQTMASDVDFIKKLKKKSYTKIFFMWFCGINQKQTKDESMKEAENIKQISSIHQTKQEKRLLFICLIIVLSIAITLFTYFSLPSNI